MADAPITFFIPLGNDRGSNAGLTVRAESVNELDAILRDLNDSVDTEVSKLDSLLDDVLTIKAGLELKGLNAAPAPVQSVKQSSHPQATSSPSDAPSCAHGAMKWKEGTSKQGNAYKGWFCPAPYGQTQCPAKFIK